MTKTFTPPASEKILQVIKEHFGIDQTDTVVSVEVLYRAAAPDAYDQLRSDFEIGMQDHPDAESMRRRKYFGPEFAVFFETSYPRKDIEGLTIDLALYYPICTREEILKIEHPTTAADFLLKVRADEIVDNARLTRVFLRRRERAAGRWSLTSHFDASPFEEYLWSLSDAKRLQCEQLEAGFAYLLEPNGACIRSPYGDVIVISETLKEYLFFMNLYLMTLDGESFPAEDSMCALFIAVRTMMLTETPDFDLDPRGDPPEPLKRQCLALAREQMQFVIGHEFAHHLLGHLGVRGSAGAGHKVIPGDRGSSVQIYSRRQEQEFDADLGALLNPDLSDSQLAFRLNATTWFFLGLDVWHAVKEYMAPPIHPSTHPSSRDRLLRLRNGVLSARNLDLETVGTDEVVRNNFDRLDSVKRILRNKVLPLQVEELEMYGSMYLPSYRPKILRDRIDF
ncbi:hypothetical protein [Variovorax sp. OV700]|uniref:hypothetical protein n=1 Tax=Variovorax sp. OV700 TaxID=1882826 RepID=UPI000886E714|nr:hypothetical protein [Variovorax sp. OV700]SDI78634.1 hypothetical protein SAMN05444748_107135 [Variovorax sp. OV700]